MSTPSSPINIRKFTNATDDPIWLTLQSNDLELSTHETISQTYQDPTAIAAAGTKAYVFATDVATGNKYVYDADTATPVTTEWQMSAKENMAAYVSDSNILFYVNTNGTLRKYPFNASPDDVLHTEQLTGDFLCLTASTDTLYALTQDSSGSDDAYYLYTFDPQSNSWTSLDEFNASAPKRIVAAPYTVAGGAQGGQILVKLYAMSDTYLYPLDSDTGANSAAPFLLSAIQDFPAGIRSLSAMAIGRESEAHYTLPYVHLYVVGSDDSLYTIYDSANGINGTLCMPDLTTPLVCICTDGYVRWQGTTRYYTVNPVANVPVYVPPQTASDPHNVILPNTSYAISQCGDSPVNSFSVGIFPTSPISALTLLWNEENGITDYYSGDCSGNPLQTANWEDDGSPDALNVQVTAGGTGWIIGTIDMDPSPALI